MFNSVRYHFMYITVVFSLIPSKINETVTDMLTLENSVAATITNNKLTT